MDAPAINSTLMECVQAVLRYRGDRAGCLAIQGRSRTGASISVVLFLAKVGSRAGYTKIR